MYVNREVALNKVLNTIQKTAIKLPKGYEYTLASMHLHLLARLSSIEPSVVIYIKDFFV